MFVTHRFRLRLTHSQPLIGPVLCVCVSTQQEWDYAYVHSFYHLSLAVSFVLLLPKKNRFAGTGRNAAKLSCFTLCCCVSCVFSTERFDLGVVCVPPGRGLLLLLHAPKAPQRVQSS